MNGQILTSCVGAIEGLHYRGMLVKTGIFKRPVQRPLGVRRLGLEGDRQADPRYHGGPYKAVYVYPSEHYLQWRHELPEIELPFGAFGENLTTQGLVEADVRVGDVFQAGTSVVKVTMPRVPCFKLGTKLGRMDILPKLLETHRSGFYLEVLEEGILQAGDPMERIATQLENPTILEVLRSLD